MSESLNEVLLSRLAAAAYPRTDANQIDLPTGWSRSVGMRDDTSGLSYATFYSAASNTIVVAFAGTNQSIDWITNTLMGYPQIGGAISAYREARQLHPQAEVVFTGHSLGGGLASIMGVLFDKTAVTFDTAPFQLFFAIPTVMNYLSAINGINPDSALTEFLAQPLTQFALREARVTGYFLDNEALEPLRSVLPTIASQLTEVPSISSSVPATVVTPEQLHSVALLSAMLHSESFKEEVRLHPSALTALFDPKLYATKIQESPRTNFLDFMLNRQIQASANSDPLADFAADLRTLREASARSAYPVLLDALVGAALWHHRVVAPNTSLPFARLENGVLRLDLSFASNEEEQGRVQLRSALANLFDDSQWRLIDRLTVAAGGAVSNAFPESLRDGVIGGEGSDAMFVGAGDDVALGLSGNDLINGGDGNDFMIGGDGDDTLVGGSGGDRLWGGFGFDAYLFASGDGVDTVFDGDGSGIILFDGNPLPTGLRLAPGLWESDDRRWTYVFAADTSEGGTLTVRRAGSTDVIAIRGWNAADRSLGIQTADTPAPATPPATPTTRTILGDRQYVDVDPIEPGIQTTLDDLGNIVTTDIVEAGRNDGLRDSPGADLIDSGGGDDTINAYAGGDDTISTGTGSDFVLDLAGRNTIDLGAGRDVLIGGFDQDIVDGGADEDRFDTGAGDDVLRGGDGDDLIGAGRGDDRIDGGAGNDYIATGRSTYPTLMTPDAGYEIVAEGKDWIAQRKLGGAGGPYRLPFSDDTYDDAATTNIVFGGAGNDWVIGDEGTDFIFGELDDDTAFGMAGNDVLAGGAGADILHGDGDGRTGFQTSLDAARHGRDVLAGDAGNDTLFGHGGGDELYGGDDDDFLRGDATHAEVAAAFHGRDYLEGGAGNDQMLGDGGNDEMSGGAGNDVMYGDAVAADLPEAHHGDDRMDGGDGDDQMVGFGGDDRIAGGDGNDRIWADDASNLVIATWAHGNDEVDAGAGDDYVEGGGGADRLLGGAGADTLRGDDGSDWLDGGDDADGLVGGADGDTLLGGAAGDTLLGEAGDDRLVGGLGVDYLDGGAGNDTYVLNAQDCAVDGTADTIADTAGANVLEFDDGTTADGIALADFGSYLYLAFGGGGLFVLNGQRGALSEVRFADGSSIDGAALVGTRLQTTVGGVAASGQTLLGGAAVDQLTVAAGAVGATLSTGRGNEAVLVGADVEALSLRFAPGDGVDRLSFAVSSNVDSRIANRIEFAPGAWSQGATLAWRHTSAGRGELTIRYTATDAVVIADVAAGAPQDDAKVDVVHFGEGVAYTWSQLLERGLTLDYAAGSANVLGTGANDRYGGDATTRSVSLLDGDDTATLGSGVESVDAGRGDDRIVYGRGDSRDVVDLRGVVAGEADTIAFDAGLAPADVRFLRSGDTLIVQIVGAADDRLQVLGFFDSFAASTVEFADGTSYSASDVPIATAQGQATAGNDFVYLGDGDDIADALGGDDTVFGGPGNDQLIGGPGRDFLHGDDGSDHLVGGTGDDRLLGGAGGDAYAVETGAGSDRIEEAGVAADIDVLRFGAGIARGSLVFRRVGADLEIDHGVGDQVTVVGHFAGGAVNTALERIELADGTVLTAADIAAATGIFGTDAADVLIGTPDDDRMAGLGGNDRLEGRAGDDTLDGGTGFDTMLGGAGDDFYEVDSVGDVVVELAGEGVDTVRSRAGQLTLAANVEDGVVAVDAVRPGAFSYIALSGNDIGNVLRTEVATRVQLAGYGGDDWLYVGDGGGNVMYGGDGNDRLFGGAGNDELVGDAGADELRGGAGDDAYFGVDLTDLVIEAHADGRDRVYLSAAVASYTLPVNVEDLSSTSQTGITIDGNALDNSISSGSGRDTLRGHAGDDVMDAGLGNDTMIGGTGNDTYYVDTTKDVVMELAGEGYDSIVTAVGLTLPANVEALTLLESAGRSSASGNDLDNVLVGNGAQNTLSGNGGNDRLDGNAGADTMSGGTGDDVYVVDNAGDKVTERSGQGIDRVESSIGFALPAHVEQLVLTGTAAINGTGNSLANLLAGNGAANVLAGGGGNDIYVGRGGDDRITTGGSAVERIAFARGDGADVVSGTGLAGEDRLELSGGIARSDVVLRRVGNDLRVEVGLGESVLLTGYFSGVRHVGTMRLIGDAGWTAGQSGTPSSFEDVALAPLAGGLALGGSVELAQSSAAEAEVAALRTIAADTDTTMAALTTLDVAPLPLPLPLRTDRQAPMAAPFDDAWWAQATQATEASPPIGHRDGIARNTIVARSPAIEDSAADRDAPLPFVPPQQFAAVLHREAPWLEKAVAQRWRAISEAPLVAADESDALLGGEQDGASVSMNGRIVPAALLGRPTEAGSPWWRSWLR